MNPPPSEKTAGGFVGEGEKIERLLPLTGYGVHGIYGVGGHYQFIYRTRAVYPKGEIMQNLLRKIDFGNEDGANNLQPDELFSFFVEQEMFMEFIDSKYKIKIASAKKGVGKSALLQWIAYKIKELDPEAVIIKCRGADLVRNKFNLTKPLTTPNDYIDDWRIRICAMINRELATRIKLAVTDDHITLIESAEIAGYKERNLFGCLLDRFQRILGDGTPVKLECANELELLKRIKNRKIWILVDDLDATFQKTDIECLQLSTFFSACRYLLEDVKDIHFRVTMRTDVWSIIRRYDESLDKAEQYVSEITWRQEDFRQLLAKRVKSELEKNKDLNLKDSGYSQEEKDEYIINFVFVSKMEWGQEEQKYTYRVIYTLSYARPRWAIQLCKLAQKDALAKNDFKIGKKISTMSGVNMVKKELQTSYLSTNINVRKYMNY